MTAARRRPLKQRWIIATLVAAVWGIYACPSFAVVIITSDPTTAAAFQSGYHRKLRRPARADNHVVRRRANGAGGEPV